MEASTSHIHKRSVSPEYDAILFKSLAAFCSELDSGLNLTLTPDPQTTATTTPPMNTTQKFDSSIVIAGPGKANKYVHSALAHDKWPRPEIFVTKVQAERVGKKVWLVFYVVHSGPAYLARIQSFDDTKVDIDYPAGLSTPVKSKVRLAVDASMCNEEESPQEGQALYYISLVDKSSYTTLMSVDLCKFDKFWNQTAIDFAHERGYYTPKIAKVVSQNIPSPLFKIVSDPGDEIIIRRRRNVTIDVDVNLFSGRELMVEVVLWDRVIGQMLRKFLAISLRLPVTYDPEKQNDGKSKIMVEIEDREKGSEEEQSLLAVDVIEETQLNYTRVYSDANDGQYRNVTARVRITVNTAEGKRSGQLKLVYYWTMDHYYERKIARFAMNHRILDLKRQNRAKIFPKNAAFIHSRGHVECDKDGIRNGRRHGRNCTVLCSGYGVGIQSIQLTKTTPSRPPVKSISYVLGDMAYAIIDVGPASTEVEGTYRCTIMTGKGKVENHDVELYTSMFTKITKFNTEKFDNGTTLVTCTAFGEQPLNMSILGVDDYDVRERLDNKTEYIRSEIIDGNVTQLTLFMTMDDTLTDYPYHPTIHLYCDARGRRGTDSDMVMFIHSRDNLFDD